MMRVIVDDRELRDLAKQLPQLKDYINNELDTWGKNLQKSMKLASQGAGKWTGDISNSIQWIKSKNSGHLDISLEGIYLDRARPHKVSLRKAKTSNIRLAEWAIFCDKKFRSFSSFIKTNEINAITPISRE